MLIIETLISTYWNFRCSPPGRESSKAASTSSRGSPSGHHNCKLSLRLAGHSPPHLADWLEPWRQLTERLPSRNFPRPPNRHASRGLLAPGCVLPLGPARPRSRPFFFRRKHSIYFDVAQTHGESLELLTECNKLPVGLDVLCDLVRVFPAQSLSDRLSRFLPGVDPIRPSHNGLPLALMRYLQILLGHRPWTHGADGPHLFEDSLPLFFQSSCPSGSRAWQVGCEAAGLQWWPVRAAPSERAVGREDQRRRCGGQASATVEVVVARGPAGHGHQRGAPAYQ